jgi:glycerophosphoryl diester phosphodiesterase
MTRPKGRSTSEGSLRGANAKGKAGDERSSAEHVLSSRGATKPLLLGHRGARPLSRMKLSPRAGAIPPENTLAAFEYALAHGCDGFEFDVRVTRDERLVLCHDARLGGRNVAASLFANLRSGCDEALPCLEDVLAAFGARAFLDIEVKVAGGEELIVNALRRSMPHRYLLSSFLPDVLRRFHQLDPSLPLGYICDRAADVRAWQELPIQAFLPQLELVTQKLIREVHSSGVQIFTWTVNRKEDLRQLAACGIDGLISDDPDLLHRTFSSPAGSGERRIANSVARIAQTILRHLHCFP